MKKPVFTILYFLFIILVLPIVSVAQNKVLSGIVIDKQSNTHLSFVRIGINNGRINAVTDINGMFAVRLDEPIRFPPFY